MSGRVKFMVVMSALSTAGCQAIGNLPGIDPTDYAYTDYKCTQTQVYAQKVPQVRSAALMAMADLGFSQIECEPKPKDAEVIINALTIDGRKTRVTIRPRNEMASMRVYIAPIGDEMVGQALIQRVALNFGTIPRTVIPMEPTLARRIDPMSWRRPTVAPVSVDPPPREATPPALPESAGPFVLSPAQPVEVPAPAVPGPPRPEP